VQDKKNIVIVSLITASLVLLLALQVAWLRGAYHQEHVRLQRDLSRMFKDMVFEMSDSLFKKNISALPAANITRIQIKDSLSIVGNGRVSARRHVFSDSLNNGSVQVMVYAQGGNDSLSNFLKPLAEKIKGSKGRRSFSINLTGEMLNEKEVTKKFDKALQKAGLPISFTVDFVKPDFGSRRRLPFEDESFVFTPSGGFKTHFSNLSSIIFKRISPQMLFSVFLTTLTGLSFWMLYRNIKSQQRLAELKNDFISNMTHELKTPVTTVGVALEALKNFNGLENPQLTQEYLAIAQNELNRLSILTDKILKTSVFENGGVQFESENVDLEKIVEQTVQSLKLVFEKADATVEIKKEGTYFNLKGGAVHITNVVYNMLDNALKYSKDKPAIVITLKENSREVVLSVQDNGVGIAPEFKKRIFEKFFRVPTGDVHNVKGYGLGLSYVDAVVKAHNGVIEIDSELGKGSSFIIRFKR
jgi:two-component system, OmpR family, phosphate regulon sensor histidine kinase PhoR